MQSKIYSLKFAAPAGVGIKSVGQLFSKILIGHKYFVHDYTEYPSLVRGGHNTYQVTFSSEPVFAPYYKLDFLVSLAPGHWTQHQSELKDNALVIGMDENSSGLPNFFNVPFKQLADDAGSIVTVNTIALGILGYVFGFDSDIVSQNILAQFPKAVEINQKAYQIGFEYAQKNLSDNKCSLLLGTNTKHTKLIDGNEAFGWGFLKGGGNFYAAYPMTPATGTLHFLAEKQKELDNLVVVHPEDEISAANMVLGAAFAGSRAATGTSGGGFALMNEAISYAAIAEIGSLFYLVSRPGPATGLPTFTSQADLLHAIYSGHGEFPLVVLAPANQTESFEMGREAINIALELQTPVIVLSDKFISESAESVLDLSSQPTDIRSPKILSSITSGFKRYDTSPADGISSYTVPGNENGAYLANSYEHNEFSFSTEDAGVTQKMVDKRFRKLKKAMELTPKTEIFGDQKAKHLIVSFGSTKGPILEALRIMQNPDFAFIQIKTVSPIDPNLKFIFNSYKSIIVVENDKTAQLATLLKSQFDFNPSHFILKYDGRPFYPEELAEKLTGLLNK